MNISGHALLWCCVQVTVLALAAIGIEAIIGRRRPAAGALVAALGLIAVVGLTTAALSPWPSWPMAWASLPRSRATGPSDVAGGAISDASVRLPMFPASDDDADDGRPSRATGRVRESRSFLGRSGEAITGNWAMLAALLYLVGVCAMAVRISVGLLAVRGYRRNSRPIADRRLAELLNAVRVQLGCGRNVELRETAALSTPATIGWRRPILLLPSDWPGWTDDECRAVLAHEIEHVRRGDFCSWIVAQIGIALHFYHPLVHWLASRLRLQQEMAADAAAARVAGGQRKYVTTLAAMALRQSDAMVAWPARAFLPTSKTFLRRIEMLHRSKSLRSDVSRPLFFLSVAAVALAAACAAGIRGSAAGDDRGAAGSSSVVASAENPADLQATDAPAKARKSMNNLKQMALAMHNYHDKAKHFPPAVIMGPDGKTPHSWRVELLPFLEEKALYDAYRMNEPWDSPANKKILEQMPDVFRSPYDDPKSTNSGYYVITGPGTLFDGTKGIAISAIKDGTSNTLLVVESKQNIPWTKPEDIPFDQEKPVPTLGGFVKGQFRAALGDGSARRFETEKVKSHLKWLIMPNDGHPIDWEKIGFAQRGNAVGRRRPLAPGDKASRNRENLKMLALAMHNYHDVHAHFPPAVTMGPDGKTPHSWRVELLPFLDQRALYDQYQKNESWDSPANKQVLERIPDVFRSPYDDPKSTHSGYFALVGTGTVFEGTKGVRIRDITDGTSNTLMIVEAKRSIPWTEPLDIPFDADKPLPELGGFVEGRFAAAIADGSFRLFDTEQTKDQLKWLIQRNDGHVIQLP
jgi:beta-lactamase regulating signal transducer with metallopeptidase domain